MGKHAIEFSTSCACNVSDCSQQCLCIDQIRYLLLKLHGKHPFLILVSCCRLWQSVVTILLLSHSSFLLAAVMIVVFVLLLPVAAVIARYYRIVFPTEWFQVGHTHHYVITTTKCSVGSHDIDDGGRGFHDNSLRPYIRAHWREVLCGKI